MAFYIGFIVGNIIYKTYLIKLLIAFSFALIFYKFSFSFQFIIFAFFTFSLISVSVTDYFHRIIPVIFPILLIIIGILSSFINLTLGATCLSRFINSILGIFAGGGVLLAIGILGQFIYKKEVMGGGDIKLMAGVGAFIGWEKVLFAIFIAAVLGSITGLILLVLKKVERKGYISFGPFLSVASFIIIFIPNPSSFFNIFFVWETHLLKRILGV
ncbi:MAG: A24 family peptidase [Endomicrobium sp.]|nr:A24 family peptidase [Endomicrobium sp.]